MGWVTNERIERWLCANDVAVKLSETSPYGFLERDDSIEYETVYEVDGETHLMPHRVPLKVRFSQVK
jgi:hypothetical protein